MGLKRVSVIGLCLAAVAAVVMLAAVIIRPPKIYISEICPSNSETSKKTAMQDKNGERLRRLFGIYQRRPTQFCRSKNNGKID